MKKDIDKIVDGFIGEDELNNEIKEQKAKTVVADRSIIERIDRIIIAENGKQLLREQY